MFILPSSPLMRIMSFPTFWRSTLNVVRLLQMLQMTVRIRKGQNQIRRNTLVEYVVDISREKILLIESHFVRLPCKY